MRVLLCNMERTKEMRKILLFICIALFASSCGKKQWEYKTISINGQTGIYGDMSNTTFNDQTATFNKLGKEGWELVGTYTEINTAFPNFGSSEYVTGIRTNTRTTVVNFVFKRPYSNDNNSKKVK